MTKHMLQSLIYNYYNSCISNTTTYLVYKKQFLPKFTCVLSYGTAI